jgi:hypothetical protein
MERSRTNGSRIIIVGTAVAVGLMSVQLLMSSTNAPAYAIDVTPSPRPALTGPFVFSSPTPIAVAPVDGVPPQTTGAQQISDQIAAVSQQVTQAVQDQSLSIEDKVQRITSLADQFNQLVAQWQQQVAQSLSGPVTAASPVSTPSPFSTPGPVPGTAGATTSDQLRAQIAAISQQMAQVSQDPSLPPDVKTQKLSALSTQFNQLMSQLQQQP